MKKEDRDEFYFAPTAKGKKGKAARAKKDEGSSKPIKHNAETFQLFDKLKLDAPITTDDIPATLEKLEAQLESYKQKVAEWEVNRDRRKQKILAGEIDQEETQDQGKDIGDAKEPGAGEDKEENDKEEEQEEKENEEEVQVGEEQTED